METRVPVVKMDTVAQQLQNLCDQMKTSNENQEKMLKSISAVEEKLDNLTKDSKRHDEILNDLKEENRVLRSEIQRLNESREKQVQRERNNDIIIKGIPPAKDDDLLWIFAEIMRALELDIPDIAVDSIFRTKSGGKIVVRLLRHIDKVDIIKRAKQARLKGKDIGLISRPNENIFINESLSPNVAKVFFEARQLQKVFGIKFVWQKEGNVYMKRNENDAVLRVGSVEEVAELRRYLETNQGPPPTTGTQTKTQEENQNQTGRGSSTDVLHQYAQNESSGPLNQVQQVQQVQRMETNDIESVNSPVTSSPPSPPKNVKSTIKSWAALRQEETRSPRARRLSERPGRNRINRANPY